MHIQPLDPRQPTSLAEAVAAGVDDGRPGHDAASEREQQRIAALHRRLILDTPAEPEFDDLVLLASEICGTPIALVSLIDRERQWFKARVGLAVDETPRDVSFCTHAIESPDALFMVEDAQTDPRFADNPLVQGDPGIRFYAGMPIVTADGEALGTVCVIDRAPRTLTSAQSSCLQALARQAAGFIELRRQATSAARAAIAEAGVSAEARIRQQHSAELLDIVLQGRELGLWDLDVATGRWSASSRELEMLGYADFPQALDDVDWRSLLHSDDLGPTLAAMEPHLRGAAPFYECTHRMRHRDGRWVWVLSRAVVVERDAAGLPQRIVGTHLDVTTSREDRIALEQARHLLEEIGRLAMIGSWALDLTSQALEWSAEVRRIHEVEPDFEPTLDNAIGFYAPEAREVIRAAVEAAIAGGVSWDVQLQLITARGRRIWVRALGYAEYANGAAIRLAGAFQDITEFKRVERALADSESRMRLLNDSMPALIMRIDEAQRYTYVNAHFERVFGVPPGAVLGRTLLDVCGAEDHATIEPHVTRALAGEAVDFEAVGRARGLPIHYRSHYVPDRDATGVRSGFHALVFDVTEQKMAEQKLAALVRIDLLTGVPNRRHFEERFATAMARQRRTPGTAALFYFDIDRFKAVNDTHGHAGGDELLRQFAKRLTTALRETDFVARYAGDEFVAIVEGIASEAEAEALGAKVGRAVRVPFMLGAMPLDVTTSIGVAMLDGHSTLDAMLAQADGALYAAKAAGRDDVRVAGRGATDDVERPVTDRGSPGPSS